MNTTFHSLYFVGIKGVGMSALAIVAKGMGYAVAGSDVSTIFITDEPLHKADILVHEGFAADHLPGDVGLVIAGAAYGDDNPELAEARRRGLPIWEYSKLLGYLSSQKKTIAIAGTHGKTTTTSILSYLLYAGGREPSYVIGTGEVSGLPSHGLAGAGDYFVTEADDYKRSPQDPTPKFLDLTPTIAVITSIEHDHPDLYPTLRDCAEAFYAFALRVKPDGLLVVHGDDPQIKWLRHRLADRRFIAYGFGEENDYQIVEENDGSFRLKTEQKSYGPFQLSLPGKHNLLNATAAVTVALHVGMSEAEIVQNLPKIQGVERRFQMLGERGSQVVIDDYAHHPTAVRMTLQTAKQRYPNAPLWVIFQPHTYSRTQALLREFGDAFQAADVAIITDIFGSARESIGSVTASDVVREIGQHQKHVMYVPYEKLVNFLIKNAPANATIITMGAGDIYKIGQAFLQEKQ